MNFVDSHNLEQAKLLQKPSFRHSYLFNATFLAIAKVITNFFTSQRRKRCLRLFFELTKNNRVSFALDEFRNC